MFKIQKHASFFKTILSQSNDDDIEEIIADAEVKDLYAILLVIREVLSGKIPISTEDLEKLKNKNKLFKFARQTW